MHPTRPLPRPARDPDAAGGLGSFLVLALIALCWWQCGSLERMTADATVRNGELWLYATDAAPGQTVEGRVRLRGGAKLAITDVTVRGFDPEGTPYRVLDVPARWGDEVQVTERRYRGGARVIALDGEDEVRFRVTVPRTVKPGWLLDLQIDVGYDLALREGLGLAREARVAHFVVPVAFHSPTASVARRLGKGLATVAVLAAMVVAPILAGRRRLGWPGVAAVVIVFAGGWPAMAIAGGHALRVHGGWWWLACALVTLACAALGVWWTRGDRFARFRLIPIRVEGVADGAYRAAGPAPAPRTMAQLEQAWLADGIAVYRKDGVVVALADGGEARVPIAAGEEVAGGAPLELLAERGELVERLARAAVGVLGEVRIELIDERKRADD